MSQTQKFCQASCSFFFQVAQSVVEEAEGLTKGQEQEENPRLCRPPACAWPAASAFSSNFTHEEEDVGATLFLPP